MLDIICEGACNPSLEAHDALVQRWVEVRDLCGRTSPAPKLLGRISASARKLVHTWHVETPGDPLVRCNVCGHGRRWHVAEDENAGAEETTEAQQEA